MTDEQLQQKKEVELPYLEARKMDRIVILEGEDKDDE
jgi:hypothetical protein